MLLRPFVAPARVWTVRCKPGLLTSGSGRPPSAALRPCALHSTPLPPPPRSPLPSTATMATAAASTPPPDPLMQYVVLRRDMWAGGPGAPAGAPWPLGAVAAQAAHAATAALWESRAAPDTVAYCDAPGALDSMTKVVLEVADGAALTELAGRLSAAGVPHRVWVEQPEGVPTALASAPARKSVLQPHFKVGKLCRVGIAAK